MLSRNTSLKFSLILNAQFEKKINPELTDFVYIQLRTRMNEVHMETLNYLEYKLDKVFDQLEERVQNLTLKGSGWSLNRIFELSIELIEIKAASSL